MIPRSLSWHSCRRVLLSCWMTHRQPGGGVFFINQEEIVWGPNNSHVFFLKEPPAGSFSAWCYCYFWLFTLDCSLNMIRWQELGKSSSWFTDYCLLLWCLNDVWKKRNAKIHSFFFLSMFGFGSTQNSPCTTRYTIQSTQIKKPETTEARSYFCLHVRMCWWLNNRPH